MSEALPSIEEDAAETVPAPAPAPVVPSFRERKSHRHVQSIKYKDHFTLPLPSSTIRFRKSKTAHRVYQNHNSQFVLEESPGEITMKRMPNSSSSLRFLRATYTLVCLFWVGFLVVLSVEILLFLILNLTVDVGATSKSSGEGLGALGTILSIPVFIHGLASALVIGGHYVIDTWGGHYLVRNFVFGRFSSVVTAWVNFVVFLGLPLFVMSMALLSGSANWWEITLMVWIICVSGFYILFAATVVFFELRACLEVIRNRFDDDEDDFLSLLKRSILLRQIHQYSGKKHKTFITRGTIPDDGASGEHFLEEDTHFSMSWYTRFTQWDYLSKLGLFEKIEEPGERVYTLDDAQGVRPFVTTNTWSLERIYCRSRNTRYVAVIKGPAALTRAQLRSSFACAVIGDILIVLLITSFLVWLDLGGAFVIIVLILVGLYSYPRLKSSWTLYQLTKHIIGYQASDKDGAAPEGTLSNHDEEANNLSGQINQDTSHSFQAPASLNVLDSERSVPISMLALGESEGIFQVWEAYRVTRASDRLCWACFVIEVGLLFVWPVLALFVTGDWSIASLFFFIGIFSGLRYYLNAAMVLEEVGHLNFVRGEDEKARWKNQSRLSDIVTNITRGRTHGPWMVVLTFFIFVFLALALGAVSQGTSADTSSDFQFTYLPDFTYPQQNDLHYPTCTFGKGLEGSPTQAMADYAFVAVLAYRTTDITQGELDQWFNSSTVPTDQADLVSDYRNETGESESAVSYKLVTFNINGKKPFALVSVRGTTNPWDMLTDAQLWSAAACMQMLRYILPVGEIFTSIMDQLVLAISSMESTSIGRVSFYKQTTSFVQYLQNSSNYSSVQITGHSLGGGLSIITGSQTGIPAVALSGPNAMISRRTFVPPIKPEALNTKVFNIIPDRDVVPRIDDVAALFQRIRCTAPSNDFVGCHDGRRSLCEIIYTCGTQDRPALCECTTVFGYPEPQPKTEGGPTFAELCANASTT